MGPFRPFSPTRPAHQMLISNVPSLRDAHRDANKENVKHVVHKVKCITTLATSHIANRERRDRIETRCTM